MEDRRRERQNEQFNSARIVFGDQSPPLSILHPLSSVIVAAALDKLPRLSKPIQGAL